MKNLGINPEKGGRPAKLNREKVKDIFKKKLFFLKISEIEFICIIKKVIVIEKVINV